MARLKDGRKVAVKVQHRALRRMAEGEITAVERLLQAVRWLQPDFGFQWLVDEMKLNLPKELDFRMEADNADRCRALLRGFGAQVVVPQVRRVGGAAGGRGQANGEGVHSHVRPHQ